jgi:hypothetical protein
MRICKKCGKDLPFLVYVEGKQRNTQRRKYCYECSPFGTRNTRKLEKLNTDLEQHRKIRNDTGVKSTCTRCHKEYYYKHNGSTLDTCATCCNRKARHKLKRKAVDYKGGKCSKCGYNTCIKALVFHHVVPREKEFTFAYNTNHSWEYVKKELDKCVLLCSNCHVEIHNEIEELKYN